MSFSFAVITAVVTWITRVRTKCKAILTGIDRGERSAMVYARRCQWMAGNGRFQRKIDAETGASDPRTPAGGRRTGGSRGQHRPSNVIPLAKRSGVPGGPSESPPRGLFTRDRPTPAGVGSGRLNAIEGHGRSEDPGIDQGTGCRVRVESCGQSD